MLRLKETALLQGASLSILTLCDVEDHSMGMELGSCISINRPCGVMLEGCCGKLASRVRRMNIADACLRIPLQLMQRNANTFTMRITHTFITTN